MERVVMWQFDEAPGAEVLSLTVKEEILAKGVIVRIAAGGPFAVKYHLECDVEWRTRMLRIAALAGSKRGLELASDGKGRWVDGSGEPLPELDGCSDVDISATAFTNTLPVRRLSLAPGEGSNIAVAYIDLPAMSVARAEQRYTCIRRGPGGMAYRYESLREGVVRFSAELELDDEGIVARYPGYAHRVR